MKEQENKLRETLLADARDKAADIIANARKEAEDIADASRESMRKLHDSLLAQAKTAAARRTRMMASAADMDIARQWLETQETRINAVLDQALAQAENADGEQLDASLTALAQEAMAAIGDESCIVRAGEAAAKRVTAAWLAQQAKALFGENATATYSVEVDNSLAGGLIFMTADGRKTFDNTYAKRMERMRSSLRLMLVNGLTK